MASVGTGELVEGIALVILSSFFFGLGENLVAAFLPEIARENALGRVSGWGWALGYVGGLISLGLCLAYVIHAQSAGAPAAEFVPVTMIITATLFALASLPTFLFLKERAVPVGRGPSAPSAWRRIAETAAQARRYAAPLFADGFESGDATRWSTAAP